MEIKTNDYNAIQNKRYLNVSQLALILNISVKTIYAKCSIGELPFFRIGSRILFDPDDLQTYILEQKQKSLRKSVD